MLTIIIIIITVRRLWACTFNCWLDIFTEMSYRTLKFNIFKQNCSCPPYPTPICSLIAFVFPVLVNGTTAYPVPKVETRETFLSTFSTSHLTTLCQVCVLTSAQICAYIFSPFASTLVCPTIIFYLISFHVVLPPINIALLQMPSVVSYEICLQCYDKNPTICTIMVLCKSLLTPGLGNNKTNQTNLNIWLFWV